MNVCLVQAWHGGQEIQWDTKKHNKKKQTQIKKSKVQNTKTDKNGRWAEGYGEMMRQPWRGS